MPFFGGTNDLAAQPEQYVYPTGPRNIIITAGNEVILTSGSDLDVAAKSSGNRGLPWPNIISQTIKFVNSWRPNALKNPVTRTLNGNYGSRTSLANWGFRGREFSGVGNMPGPIPDAKRPMWNNLTPIIFRMRDLDYASQAQLSDLQQFQVIQVAPTVYTPPGNASLTVERIN